MKKFWLTTGVLFALLLVIAVTGTMMVQQRPLVIDIISVTPELVQLRANTPLQNATAKNETVQVDTFGADIDVQHKNIFIPGETYSIDLDEVINRFGQETSDVQVDIQVPDTLQYFIANDARLGVYNLQKDTTNILTPEGFLVNEYVVAGGDIYLLGVPKEQQTSDMWNISRLQSMYKWDNKSRSLKQILSADDWDMQGLQTSPDGRILALYRVAAGVFTSPDLWLYDTQAEAWQPHWNERFGAGSAVHFSSDNAWMLGVDLVTNGYSLSPVSAGPDVIPIGNYFEDIGISASGQYMLFKTYAEEDVFTNKPEFTLFDNSGTSENIFTDEDATPLFVVFDETDDMLWFTYKNDEDITQIGRYDIETKKITKVTNFTEDQEIISLKKVQYTDALLYGIRKQEINIGQVDGIQDLLDSYYSEDNQPVHHVMKYNLTSEEGKRILEGMIFGR